MYVRRPDAATRPSSGVAQLYIDYIFNKRGADICRAAPADSCRQQGSIKYYNTSATEYIINQARPSTRRARARGWEGVASRVCINFCLMSSGSTGGILQCICVVVAIFLLYIFGGGHLYSSMEGFLHGGPFCRRLF